MLRALTQTILGFDIGGTKTAIVEGTVEGEILQRVEMPTNAETPFGNTFPTMLDIAREIRSHARSAGRKMQAIGVSIGGPLRVEAGELVNPPHLPGWHGVSLKQHLMDAFPLLPVYIEHDGNAGALAAYHFGIGRQQPEIRDLVFLTFGTGIGAGVIINGQVLYGRSETAGEIGHWRLAERGPTGFGKTGSWEGFASGAGLVALAHLHNPTRWQANTTIRELVDAMLADDPEALQVATEAGKWMGRGLALLVDLLNPQAIVLGTLAVVLGDRILGPARAELAREALAPAVAVCQVQATTHGKAIGDVAALMPALVGEQVASLRK
ncbi:MAG: ROK family protein [Bacteroidota bacterium]